ncbi:hypothetical protein F5882DRAFT_380261 [Hyaloscypha sp. PMI_1271]|nr:hypothetical protein F5882DRAFT_380261 [Hyaloscypha sp. PMI_1271]
MSIMLEGYLLSVNAVAFSLDGTVLWTLEGYSLSVNAVVFSLDDDEISRPSRSHRITRIVLQTLKGYSRRVTAIVFSPDSNYYIINRSVGLVRQDSAGLGHGDRDSASDTRGI